MRLRPRRSTSRCAAAGNACRHGRGEARIARRGARGEPFLDGGRLPAAWRDLADDFDADDLSDGDLADLETELVDEASAARTVAELEREIGALNELERLAAQLRSQGEDRKWGELSALLTGTPEMYDAGGGRRKMIIFSEHRDTLNYLAAKLRGLLGRQEAVVTIHGGMHRDERRKVQEAFTQDPQVLVLVATDAAGEGINLQRAHLMVNYDLPWNPNRIEQRFGRIHRIGQTEVCHLWNLVAEDTREGQVFQRLFDKLDEQRRALGGQVFDVLGQAFADMPLRDLLIEAVRYGERPDVRDRLNQVVDATVGKALREVVQQRSLVSDLMTADDVEHIREELDRAQAKRLQPYFIQSFFIEAFTLLGGEIREREPDRFEITKVPAEFRQRDRLIGTGAPVPRRYERVTFDRDLVTVDGRPRAQYVAPGHPLLDVTVDLVIERFSGLMQQGAVLIDDRDQGDVPRTLIYLQHAVTDGLAGQDGDRRTVSKRFEFVGVTPDGQAHSAGWAPYLDLRPASAEELRAVTSVIEADWVRGNLEEAAVGHGVMLARAHLDEVRRRTLERVDRVAEEVSARLLPEIQAWDHRSDELRQLERAGRLPSSGMNSANARQRTDDLKARLRTRLAQLDAQRQLSSSPPVVAGGALVVPAGLLARLRGQGGGHGPSSRDAAVAAVLRAETSLGRTARRTAPEEQGYDVESRAADGSALFIMVRHREAGGSDFLVTRSELGVARNTGGNHLLALVDDGHVRYLRQALAEVPQPAIRDSHCFPVLAELLPARAGAPVTQDGQSMAGQPAIEPGAAARDLIHRAKALSTAIGTAAAAVESRRQEARGAYELARANVVRARLDELPLDKIKEVTQGRLRLSAIEQAGYRSVGAVLRAGPAMLQAIRGVGPTSATQVVAAARSLRATLENQVRVRFDPDARTPAQARLLAKLYAYELAKALVPPQAPDFARLASDLDVVAGEAKPAGSRLRMFFTGSARKQESLSAAGRLAVLLQSPAALDAQRRLQAAAAAGRADSSWLWKDYLDRPVTYNGLLIEVADLAPSDESVRGFLPQDIARQIHAYPLDLSLVTASLRGYQGFGAKFALVQERVIIGDEMGLGKTLQALAAMAHLAAGGETHFLVVCPASVVVNWAREIAKHTRLTAYRLHGPERARNRSLWVERGGVGGHHLRHAP